MNQKAGSGSLRFKEAPFVLGSASVVGTKEGEGPLGELFDMVGADDRFGADSWEKAESSLQKEALTLALGKSKKNPEDIRYLFAGDLLGQTMATSFGLKNFEIPLFGLYGACSTCGEALSLGAMCVAAEYADNVATVTSSHFGSAEKQFRFPLSYANQRPVSATWTVTGSGAFILGKNPDLSKNEKSNIRITSVTTGKIVDYGVKDSMNMGAAMAPGACELIVRHFRDLNTTPKDYDLIVTGDLGEIGSEILCKLVGDYGYDISGNHEDCGVRMFDNKNQNTGSGGSGCGCSATVLSAYYIPMLKRGNYKKILFVPTGALLSPVSFNEGQSVPGIAHGVVFERSEN